MTLKTTTRKFALSYGELLQQVFEKSTFLRRDESMLAQRGITSADLDAFDAMIGAFRALKEDSIYIGLISDAIQQRDDKRKQVTLMCRDIIGIAETVYGKKSGIYKSFGTSFSESLSDGKFLIAVETLYSKANEYSEALNPRGLTTEMLAEFKTRIEELEPLMKYAASIKSERDINTRNRHTIANQLYAEMTKLCLIACNYFKDRDSSRFADYVIYSQGKAAQSRSGTLPPKSIVSRSFTGLKAGVLFKLKNEGTGSLDFYFSTTEEGLPVTERYTVPAFQEKVVAIESLGYDAEAGVTKFTVRNLSDSETSSYLVRVE